MKISDGKLRSLEKDDLELLFNWRNSERIRASMFSDHIITREEHYSWFSSLKDKEVVYLIFELNNQAVGLSDFTDIDYVNNRCWWGFYLGENNLPRGTGLLMGYWSMEYAFSKIKIRKLCSNVLSKNTVSINYHKKLGFTEEGVFRQHIKKGNQYEDIVYLSQFDFEWQIKRDEIINTLRENY